MQVSQLLVEKSELLAKQQQLENGRLALEAQRDDLKLHVEGWLYAAAMMVCAIWGVNLHTCPCADVMQSLAAKDDTIFQLNRSAEEKERSLRSQLAELQGKSKHRLGDLNSQVEQLQGEVARRMMETEKLTDALSSITKANEENKVSGRSPAVHHQGHWF